MTNWFIIVKRVILRNYKVLVDHEGPMEYYRGGDAKSTLQFNNTNSSLHVLPSDACSYIKFVCIKISHTYMYMTSTRERHNVL